MFYWEDDKSLTCLVILLQIKSSLELMSRRVDVILKGTPRGWYAKITNPKSSWLSCNNLFYQVIRVTVVKSNRVGIFRHYVQNCTTSTMTLRSLLVKEIRHDRVKYSYKRGNPSFNFTSVLNKNFRKKREVTYP